MNRGMLCTLVTLSVSLASLACTSKKSASPQPTASPQPAAIDSDLPPGAEVSAADIKDLSYDPSQHSLAISLAYTGCSKVAHSLSFGSCAESYPAQCQARLIRPQGEGITCQAYIEEVLNYPLPETFDTSHLTISNKSQQSKSVLVDRLGKIKD